MSDSVIPDLVAAIGAAESPPHVATPIVAIDGQGGAGKSTLARRLAGELEAQIVHTDDFASWDNPIEWWPTLLETVLEPLAAGLSASFTPTSWGGPPKRAVSITPGRLVLLEGVTASRLAFRPFLTYSIWVETTRAVRLHRGLERDGADALSDWERWMAVENDYVAREQPARHADAVLRGDADLWS